MGKETRLLTLAAIGLCILAAVIVLTSKKKTTTPPIATTTADAVYDNNTTANVPATTGDNSNNIASAYKTLDQNGVIKEETTPVTTTTTPSAPKKVVAPQATPTIPNDAVATNTIKRGEFTEKGGGATRAIAPVKPLRPAAPKGGFAIIGGAFSDKDNAKSELARLKKMGFGKATLSTSTDNGFETITLAHFNDEADARDYVARCKKKGVSAYLRKN